MLSRHDPTSLTSKTILITGRVGGGGARVPAVFKLSFQSNESSLVLHEQASEWIANDVIVELFSAHRKRRKSMGYDKYVENNRLEEITRLKK